ncbi:uncharacterized protein SPPG_03706 [Spizellomyces punctatus DAOM BR117]|uniref:SH3 domain-containing protein n=1 Tax=Spizellomyces punctatus (strain DAOM BR117) TaxID=645134 RepID=A0A0L0HHM6_SPIPD|nr:uncharacterized protein SPPG_03706 [Spizellomyces punctatus DAOM BR117]KND00582.1 hypothetical protein SPPG_03706 [Spizellomyces punctatus DAOM BR117]|eukprot:XP_016608621.1 hypothetical protein SPPG_03706 [Spizellomyces punctatus DAOM BR117]
MAEKIEERFVAYAGYVPVHGDELQLTAGDRVILLHAYDDGWILAKNEQTGAVGLAPRNFLQNVHAVAPVEGKGAAKTSAPSRVASLVVGERRSSHLGTKRALAAKPPGLQEVKKKMNDLETGRRSRARGAADIGNVKLSIVGDSGIGKTTLIHELLSIPEITAADPIPPNNEPFSSDPSPLVLREYRASTVPTNSLLVAEEKYNLRIIDSPGYGCTVDALSIIRPVVAYHLAQFQKTNQAFTREATPTQLVRFLAASTGAHTHVDVSVYCMLHRITGVDVEYMRRLAKVSSVVPVLVRSDTMTFDEAFAAKKEIIEVLAKAGIETFGFGLSKEELMILVDAKTVGVPPFAISARAYKRAAVRKAQSKAVGEGEERNLLNEFGQFKEALLLLHLDELRRVTADRFVRWRSAGSPKEID